MTPPSPHHPQSFIGAGFSLLLTMQLEDLPTPMSISWRDGYGTTPRLYLQVAPGDWRVWLDELNEPELYADTVDDTWHVHAEGALTFAPATRVHLVTVTDNYPAVAS